MYPVSEEKLLHCNQKLKQFRKKFESIVKLFWFKYLHLRAISLDL